MTLNSDFSARVVVHAADMPWAASPMAGVDRRMLDRIGEEVARATTIVRYAPGSTFSAHTHTGGEEFIVLDGVFQDEHGNYPAGTYVRNPPTSSHTPGSAEGCTIFVKLWQFDPDDRTQFCMDMTTGLGAFVDGVRSSQLYQDTRETVTYIEAKPDATISITDAGGIEVLVLSGSVTDGADILQAGSWVRLPDGMALDARSGAGGATVWVKTGHLRFAKAPTI